MRHIKLIPPAKAVYCGDQYSALGILIGYLQDPLNCKKALDSSDILFADKPGDPY